ncbi:MAG: hypothetical protein M1831_004570 [Alyxoria varia]|nr:MAG: hypothetical protein M1831_004570 [Alyxoria varia]
MSLTTWALPRLSHLLPLDEESLRQIITYTDTLPKQAASEHLKNLLGDSSSALEFISDFNIRRPAAPSDPSPRPTTTSSSPPATPGTAAAAAATATHASSRDASESEGPRSSGGGARGRGRGKKGKQPFSRLPPTAPRRVDDAGSTSGAYIKKNDEHDYMPGQKGGKGGSSGSKPNASPRLANTLSLNEEPDAKQLLQPTQQQAKLPPSAAGRLISDGPHTKQKLSSSKPSSRAASPASTTTTTATSQSKQSHNNNNSITTSLAPTHRGTSTHLTDLDHAIRTLELQTNPTLTPASSTTEDRRRRKCPCNAQRHPLLAAAPNCLSCGKIICAKEGLGPCTFCGAPLLKSDEVQAMMRVLKEERGKEKQATHNAAQTRANRPEVSRTPKAFTQPEHAHETEADKTAKLKEATRHRDRLLTYQAQNAKRAQIHDEAADFETPDAGTNHWASPEERALQLRRQQKVLREQEWSRKGEWEKRRVVVGLDLTGKKGKGQNVAVRRMEKVEKPDSLDDSTSQHSASETEDQDDFPKTPISGTATSMSTGTKTGTGQFSRNPLLTGNLVRPIWKASGNSTTYISTDTNTPNPPPAKRDRGTKWRVVQDDRDADGEGDGDGAEKWILDGGAYGYGGGGGGGRGGGGGDSGRGPMGRSDASEYPLFEARRLGAEEHAEGVGV